MLNSDLYLSHEAETRSAPNNRYSKTTAGEENRNGFHYISFVPIDGTLWKLDGLDRQPVSLGAWEGEDWLQLARQDIEERLADNDGLQYGLQAVCRSPLVSLPQELAMNVCTLLSVEGHLQRVQPDWQAFTGADMTPEDTVCRGPEENFHLTQEMIDAAQTSRSAEEQLEDPSTSAHKLLRERDDLLIAQAGLRAAIMEEIMEVEQDNERAVSRRHDLTPAIYRWLKALAERDILRRLTEVGNART